MQYYIYRFSGMLAVAVLMSACGRPIADFTYAYEKNEQAPAKVRFDNQSQKAATFQWVFGDGNTATDSLPVHEYKASGTYTVQLTAANGKKTRTVMKELTIAPPDRCLVEIETKFGTMLVELYDDTPQHRDNFLKLAEDGFYDGLLFHRVINNFMVQGGDPSSREAKPGQQLGIGGSGYTIPAEFVDTLVHVKGALAAARQGDQVNPEKRSSGSQFYIVHGQTTTRATLDQIEGRKGFRYGQAQRDAYAALGGTPFLDRDYTVFGRVIEGLEVIDAIATAQTAPGDRPVEDIAMKMRVIK
ncbi:MAG TPA: peptidylprolyl isomerase [Saprospiraceae bacterium]|nr:peptidylprolyl isomerase [Saprospiraceae bacterium]HMP24578.1 peptidylprolyl isomerase [Saprospiraceae bacterium]